MAQQLIANHKTLAVAESCTGGLLTHRLTNVPGSSCFLHIGIVAYSNEAKARTLHIPPAMLRRYGAVSEQTAIAMARAARKIHHSDFGVGITGIAGPGGGSYKKPIGLTYIAINTGTETLCLQCHFQGERLAIKSKAANQALRLLNEFLT